MIGLMAFAGWSARENAPALKKLGEIAAAAPDNPASLISRRRPMFTALFAIFLVSRESFIPIPLEKTSKMTTQPLPSSLEIIHFLLQTRCQEFPEGARSRLRPEYRLQIRRRAERFPDRIHFHPDPSLRRCLKTSGGHRGECSALPTSRARATFPEYADIPRGRN